MQSQDSHGSFVHVFVSHVTIRKSPSQIHTVHTCTIVWIYESNLERQPHKRTIKSQTNSQPCMSRTQIQNNSTAHVCIVIVQLCNTALLLVYSNCAFHMSVWYKTNPRPWTWTPTVVDNVVVCHLRIVFGILNVLVCIFYFGSRKLINTNMHMQSGILTNFPPDVYGTPGHSMSLNELFEYYRHTDYCKHRNTRRTWSNTLAVRPFQ